MPTSTCISSVKFFRVAYQSPNPGSVGAGRFGRRTSLRTIMNTAVADEVIAANPCRVRGDGSARRVKKIRPATLPEPEALVKALPQRSRRT